MIKIREKSGSSAVFLSIILASLIAITLSLIYASRENVRMSIADGSLNLAGDSVLSEYDYYVQRDYGLFVLNGSNRQLSAYISDYSGYPAEVSAGRFSTSNPEPVRRQIIACTLPGFKSEYKEPIEVQRTLRHRPTVTSLPSRTLPDRSIIASAGKLADDLKNPGDVFHSGTDRYRIDSYILSRFNNAEGSVADDHFFSNEVEYIVCGELSDEKNAAQTDLALKALRTGLNLSHIYSDPEKRAAVSAAAEILTPGVLGTVTMLGISTAWATAEAINDVKLLHRGMKVPIIKTSESWAVTLDSLINGYKAEDGCIIPAADTGRCYDEYLRMLLFIKDENVKIARILDLVQINMRKNHDSDFVIHECVTGISIEAYIGGGKLAYDKLY